MQVSTGNWLMKIKIFGKDHGITWIYKPIQNENGLIVLNVDAWKTSDGGKSFKKINVGHGDTHDVWINPLNPENFIIGDDGGEVTWWETFTELDTPTSHFIMYQ
jgi:hypothetical protein